jgi:hypothetical protein
MFPLLSYLSLIVAIPAIVSWVVVLHSTKYRATPLKQDDRHRAFRREMQYLSQLSLSRLG